MTSCSPLSSRCPAIFITAIVLTAIGSNPGTSMAGLTLTLDSSTATSEYAIYSTNSNFSTAPFNSSNMLVYPGGALPVLAGVASDTTTQYQSGSSMTSKFTTNATTDSSSSYGYVPTTFGTAETQVGSGTTGAQGAYTSQGGVYWSSHTTLADNLPTNSGEASVSFSTATATYTNNSGVAMSVTPGGILSVTGTLGSIGPTSTSYAAAGLFSSYTIYDPTTQTSTTTNLDSIILAANGQGTDIALTGDGPKEYVSVSVSGGVLSGTGTSLSPVAVSIPNGDKITISSYLTLISDPGSGLGITLNLPPNFPSDPSYLPDFGTYANAPDLAVPEPSSILLMTAGLSMAGLWACRNRRRSQARI